MRETESKGCGQMVRALSFRIRVRAAVERFCHRVAGGVALAGLVAARSHYTKRFCSHVAVLRDVCCVRWRHNLAATSRDGASGGQPVGEIARVGRARFGSTFGKTLRR